MSFIIEWFFFFFQAEDGIRDAQESRGLGDVYKRQKFHTVLPVRSGRRRVLVVEVWDGEERDCAHRCSVRVGHCNFRVDAAERKLEHSRSVSALARSVMWRDGAEMAIAMLAALCDGRPEERELVVEACSQQWDYVLEKMGCAVWQKLNTSSALREALKDELTLHECSFY
eukprot:TRINITY_DN14376_c0_g1_i1.p1 TRINITY_DN14376_c0_g1~~TRINITY_DN14376_c0_g1_i1.p1  ORF type:complete len:170 (+),score=50.68 TRINITY_DN14376_c0_g1_i1:59-568(+)